MGEVIGTRKLATRSAELGAAVNAALNDPEFWLHRSVYGGWLRNPFDSEPLPAAQAVAEYRRTVADFLTKPLFDFAGARVGPLVLERLFDRTEWLNGVSIYGLMVVRTDLKLLPCAAPLFHAPHPRDLDRNQQSGLEIGDSCQIFAWDAGRTWYGVITRRGAGWVPARAVALSGAAEVDHHATQLPALITLDPQHQLRLPGGIAREVGMGCSFPAEDPFRRIVLIPARTRNGGLKWRQAELSGSTCVAHLAPTVPNLIRQAFKYLGRRYVWGDRNPGGRSGIDCSRLVQNVFRTIGWLLPRNSQQQWAASRAGLSLGAADAASRRALLAGLAPGSLLFTNHHVLIYLGQAENDFYAIHACYNYPERTGERERPRAVKRVIVSDLELGRGSLAGALWQRLTGVVPLLGKEEWHEAIAGDGGCDYQG